MQECLNEYYFRKTSALIEEKDISGALACLEQLDFQQMNDSLKKLTGLCHYRMGNYGQAMGYLEQYEEYVEISTVWSSYNEYIEKVKSCIQQNKQKEAYAVIRKASLASVNEYNVLGCFAMIQRDKKTALACFKKALAMDVNNKTSVRLMAAAVDEPSRSFRNLIFELFTNPSDSK